MNLSLYNSTNNLLQSGKEKKACYFSMVISEWIHFSIRDINIICLCKKTFNNNGRFCLVLKKVSWGLVSNIDAAVALTNSFPTLKLDLTFQR